MAFNDIYQLDVRTDYAGVSLRNRLFYRHLVADPSFNTGAQHLCNAFFNETRGAKSFFQAQMTRSATLSICIARRVESVVPDAPTELDAVLGDNDDGALLDEGLPPSSTAVWQANCFPQPDTDVKTAPQALIYVGALGTQMTNGVWFIPAFMEQVRSQESDNLISPGVAAVREFALVARYDETPTGETRTWKYGNVTWLNYNFYPSRRKSRQFSIL